jgi:ATP-dependent RNA helicase DBP3
MSKDAVETVSKEERKRLKKQAKEQAKIQKAEGDQVDDSSECKYEITSSHDKLRDLVLAAPKEKKSKKKKKSKEQKEDSTAEEQGEPMAADSPGTSVDAPMVCVDGSLSHLL